MGAYFLPKIASRLKFLVSSIIQRELADPRLGLVTVLRVAPTGDLKEAKVYVSVFGGDGAESRTLHALSSASRFIQRQLGKNLRTKNVPSLTFVLDDGQDRVSRIEALASQTGEEPESVMAKKPQKKNEKASASPKVERSSGSKGSSVKGKRAVEAPTRTRSVGDAGSTAETAKKPGQETPVPSGGRPSGGRRASSDSVKPSPVLPEGGTAPGQPASTGGAAAPMKKKRGPGRGSGSGFTRDDDRVGGFGDDDDEVGHEEEVAEEEVDEEDLDDEDDDDDDEEEEEDDGDDDRFY